MSNVVLSIGGRKFTVSCANGEEEHVGALGAMIDEKVEALGDTAGQNEVRMLLYAALVLADELNELRSNAPEPSDSGAQAPAGSSVMSEQLERIAVRIEKIAGRLEAEPDNA